MRKKRKKPEGEVFFKKEHGRAEVKKPEIPKDVLDKFLDQKISTEDKKRISQRECASVGRDRYRVNVWLQEFEEGQYYPKTWMGYSYYLHYKDGDITDKTIYPKPKENKFF